MVENLITKFAELKIDSLESDHGTCLKYLRDLLLKIHSESSNSESLINLKHQLEGLILVIDTESSTELQERVLLAVQIYSKSFDYQSWEGILSRIHNSQDFLWLSRLRADLIIGCTSFSKDLVERLLYMLISKDANRIISSTIVECATMLINKQLQQVDHKRLLEVLSLALWQQDELVLQKSRILALNFAKIGELSEALVKILSSLDRDSKMHYLILKDFLEAQIYLTDWSERSALDLEDLFGRLVENKALAPIISDCIIWVVKRFDYTSYSLLEYFTSIPDPDCLIGQYFFPRLVAKMPDFALSSIIQLSTMANDESLLIQQYCALYLAIVNNPDIKRALVPSASRLLLRKALISHSEDLRMSGFSCLCKSIKPHEAVDAGLCQLLFTYLFDMTLEGSSDSRQQLIAALKSLYEVHLVTLLHPLKSNPSFPPSQMAEEVIFLWSQIVRLCKESIVTIGFFNKNDLCLNILYCIITVFQQKLKQCGSKVKERMESAYHRIIETINTKEALSLFSSVALENSFAPVRSMAANIWKELVLLNHPDNSPLSVDLLISMSSDRRAHIVDGAALMLKVVCDVNNSHDATSSRLLEIIGLELDVLDVASFSHSKLLGLLTLAKALHYSHSSSGVKLLEYCQRLCLIVLPLVSHPSPEGHSSDIKTMELADGDADQVDDDDAEDSAFSQMNFSWRAVKISASLFIHALRSVAGSIIIDGAEWQKYGKFLIGLITSIRHPGAFVALAKPIKDFCLLAFANGQGSIVEELFSLAINICSSQPMVQTTRRSAGLPFCFTSIISSVPTRFSKLRKNFLDRIWGLLPENLENDDEDDRCLSRTVHVLNILRQIFRESSLAEDIVYLVPKAYQLSSRALTSSTWAIRNSGLLMFVALLNRTFGVRHDADDYSPVNCVDPRTIFARYGEQFRSADDFADFAILQRYRWSSGGEARHGEFYKKAFEFAWGKLDSEKLKERRMASRLLLHMTESPLLKNRIMTAIREEPPQPKANNVHGRLELLRLLEERGLIPRERVAQLIESPVYQKFNQCYPIQVLLEENPPSSPAKSSDVSWEELLQKLDDRTIPFNQLDEAITRVLLVLVNDPNQQERIALVFQGFWTKKYDLEGSYRLALLRNWTPQILRTQAIRRIWYLALTDEDDNIRYWASIKFGGGSFSVARHLRHLIFEYSEELHDLMGFMPSSETESIDKSRTALFSPEPLNGFKDVEWERKILASNPLFIRS